MKDALYHYAAVVTKVIDGDTIVVDVDLGFSIHLRDQYLRLARINTPELKGSTKTAGLKSKDALASKLANKKIYIKTRKVEKDKYGRILAEVYADDECVNDWLLQEGLAVPYLND